MSFDSEVFDYEEILEMYDEICDRLKDRPDLIDLFIKLVKKGDCNYETESSVSSEDYSDSEVCKEKIVIQNKEGYLSIK